MPDSDRYAVFGNPVRHSKSPQIHAEFAHQCQQRIQYRAVKVEPHEFKKAVRHFFQAGGKGLNITVPFKGEAFSIAQEATPRAELAAAVNTLWRNDAGVLVGDNTDGVGLVRDIRENHGWDIRGQRVLVLGAGGAVRGVLSLLLAEEPAELVVANRSEGRALELAARFAELGSLEAIGLDGLTGRSFDFIINGTSASLSGDMPALPDGLLGDRGQCYDMVYGAEPTAFMRWAAEQAAWAVTDGLGMLVEQAAESFYLWRGVRPETEAVITLLRSHLQGQAA